MASKRDTKHTSGIFSNVLGFVSREIGSFVTSAVGLAPSSSQRSSSSRVRHSDKPYKHREDIIKRRRRKKPSADDHASLHSKPRAGGHHPENGSDPEREILPPPLPSKRKFTGKRSSKAPPTQSQPDNTSSRPSPTDQPNNSQSRSMAPPPIPRVFLKKPSVTMPGSLFPRSPSLEPGYATTLEEERRVHFAASTITPLPRSYSDLMREATEGGPSYPAPKPREPPTIDPPFESPVRINSGPSVKNVVDRFADDADSSLMLPNPTTSPGRAPPSPSRRTIGESTESEPLSLSAKSKGKQRATEWDFDFLDADMAADSSGVIRVKGKVQELLEAREEHMRKEQDRELDPDQSAYFEERERDKERIRDLEAEISELKKQLAHQRASPPDTTNYPLPPIPPPPPPPNSSWLPTLAEIRSRTGGSAAATESFLLSARASLKPTAPPVEAPINPVVYGYGVNTSGYATTRTKRTGHPTVNVPTEKMASFLNEVRSAKLKKISNHFVAPPIRPGPEEVGNVSLGSAGFGRDILRDMARRKSLGSSLRRGESASESSIREKRKRNDVGESTDPAIPAKQREQNVPPTTLLSDSSASSFASMSSSRVAAPLSRSNHPYNRTWPSITTEMTTPSLTSDNENENEHEGVNSPENGLPATPPSDGEPPPPTQSQTSMSEKDESQFLPESQDDHIHAGIYPYLEHPSSPPKSPTPSPPEVPTQSQSSGGREALGQGRGPSSSSGGSLLGRRVPSSPLPNEKAASRKPLPPARSRRATRRIVDEEAEGSQDDGEQELEHEVEVEPELEPEPVPVVVKAKAKKAAPTRIPKKQAVANSRARSAKESKASSSSSQENGRGGGVNGGGGSGSNIPRPASSSSLRLPLATTSTSAHATSNMSANSAAAKKRTREEDTSAESNHAKRRRMLDAELREAGDRLWSQVHENDDEGFSSDCVDGYEEIVAKGVDDGVLSGMGTKSRKKGFMAGGGAGGVPVFMGAGYVKGVDEGMDVDVDVDVDEFRDEGFKKARSLSSRRVKKRGETSRRR